MTEVVCLTFALVAMVILVLALVCRLWTTEKRCEALDTESKKLRAELNEARSHITDYTKILDRQSKELKAAEWHEAETAAQVARVMGSMDAEPDTYVVRIGYCTALIDDYPAILHNMLEIAERDIVAKWRARQKEANYTPWKAT